MTKEGMTKEGMTNEGMMKEKHVGDGDEDGLENKDGVYLVTEGNCDLRLCYPVKKQRQARQQ